MLSVSAPDDSLAIPALSRNSKIRPASPRFLSGKRAIG